MLWLGLVGWLRGMTGFLMPKCCLWGWLGGSARQWDIALGRQGILAEITISYLLMSDVGLHEGVMGSTRYRSASE